MDFKQIEAFINVAKYKSFSKAANAIFLSQPAVSSNISILEKELHIQLFDRTSKEVLLTPAGESFLKYAIDMINTRDKAIDSLSNFNGCIVGTLKLAASTTPCNTIVPVLIRKFSDKYPNIAFNIMEQSSGEIIENISKFNFEIGIIGSYLNDDKISCYKMMEDEIVIISSKKLDIPKEISIDSLNKYKLILREKQSATRKTFENTLIENNVSLDNLNIVCEVNNLDSIIKFVDSGIGISMVSSSIFNSTNLNTNDIRISRIKNIPIKRNIYFAVSAKRTLTPIAKAFFDMSKAYFI